MTPPSPPLDVLHAGVVVLYITIDSDGAVRNIATIAGGPPFAKLSLDAIQQWRFAPARDSNETRIMSVTFLYRPRRIYTFESEIRVPEPPTQPSRPPSPRFIADAPYPIQSVAEGVVILDLDISETGAIAQIRTIRDVPSLTQAARQAVAAWRFAPATFAGKPVEGSSIAVISFLRPVTN